jgi:hypothetical protein
MDTKTAINSTKSVYDDIEKIELCYIHCLYVASKENKKLDICDPLIDLISINNSIHKNNRIQYNTCNDYIKKMIGKSK